MSSSSTVRFEEGFVVNSHGLKLYTCRWVAENHNSKALVFICHGYAMECSISMEGTGMQLAKAGYDVHGIDYEGHGKSSGLQGYISSFDDLVTDCSDYFISVCEKKENKMKKRYLLGESMGGAVAIKIHRKNQAYWDGAILVAPMCKIAEEMRPHPIVINVLQKLCKIIPTWRIIPTQDIIDSAIKNPEWRDVVRNNPYCYKGKPRLRTGHELLMVSLDIEENLDKVSLPFMIVHGGADTVTDSAVSQALYDKATSKDKTFKLYPGMWHALTSGEPQENIDLVFFDIVAWLNERSMSTVNLESEMKIIHDVKKI
ncbi:caffeoylshikimate esterase-like isoform X1 [Dioscorea cayenensis subsp. rotundata]|uniref:Caffeoylshikimate esterase-like isoform X1 n=2 Tax=Dioscorea cayennensis subsp. rotundata TaxID=55577 RepID=A0AB40BWZ8_DIOCR|nr:caffeoylshikimate esterase-like isoform X1 [Dioscorea cayenensis subsp. rotundata]